MSSKNLSRWSGIACSLAGVLLAPARLVHPSRETLRIILDQEAPLIAAHWFYIFFCGFCGFSCLASQASTALNPSGLGDGG
jgi:hypothetical protein